MRASSSAVEPTGLQLETAPAAWRALGMNVVGSLAKPFRMAQLRELLLRE